MHVIDALNVCDGYSKGMEYLRDNHTIEKSRVGDVLVAYYPVTTVFCIPNQRVLLNYARGANPFFHLFEALWMLTGSNDGEVLDNFIHDFTKRFADDGTILHGAYGHRWIYHFGVDQIQGVIDHLKAYPNSRRAVLQMWDPRTDLNTNRLDLPCNTTIYFRINRNKLDMQVNCRSNDIIWGLYGANAVHMSVLMEYIATSLGLNIGTYYHISFNFHAYKNIFNQLIPFAHEGNYDYQRLDPPSLYLLVTYPDTFRKECRHFIRFILSKKEINSDEIEYYRNEMFVELAFPMLLAHRAYKKKDFDRAKIECSKIIPSDWAQGCLQWIQRQEERRNKRRDSGELNYETEE